MSEPPRRRRATHDAATPASGRRLPATTRSGRRRFSLPPLDDDHERVSRSIESFLGGVDAGGATEPARSTEAVPGIATTVAIVVVDGLPDAAAADRPAPIDDPTGGENADAVEVADALAMIERTLRGAARGSDVVTTGGVGAYRIVLPSTGEHAAHAYLRRIRATIEPRLEAAERPLRLAVATATALDEPLEDVVRRAEGRLATALDEVRAPARQTRRATDRADRDDRLGTGGSDQGDSAADPADAATGSIEAGPGPG